MNNAIPEEAICVGMLNFQLQLGRPRKHGLKMVEESEIPGVQRSIPEELIAIIAKSFPTAQKTRITPIYRKPQILSIEH